MTTTTKQFSMRPDAETWQRIERLIPLASAQLGIRVSQATLFRLALIALEKSLCPPGQPTDAPTTRTTTSPG
jgi:hypothetical protein